jgi:hypothetical protein
MHKLLDDANEQLRVRERARLHWPLLALIGFMIVDYFWLSKWG